MHKKAYIYPISARYNGETYNPYLDNFMSSLSEHFIFLNKNKPSKLGVIDIYRYLPGIAYVFFHWPEDMVDRKMGFIQALSLYGIVFLCKIFNVRIIYVLHNKVSHSQKNFWLKRRITKLLVNNGNIITHAFDGITFSKSINRKDNNVFYFPHPIDNYSNETNDRTIDVLIWGSINSYKGIHLFLEQLQKNNINKNTWKVLIAGKANDEEYLKKLESLRTENVQILNKYLKEDELLAFIASAKIVLFPYQIKSILSSGAFAKTMAFPVNIIGPECGAFKDFRTSSTIHTFNNYEELLIIVDRLIKTFNINDLKENHKYLSGKYSWDSFGKLFAKRFLQS